MSIVLRPGRNEFGVQKRAEVLLIALWGRYQELAPNADVTHFIEKFVTTVARLDDPSVEEPMTIVMQFWSKEDAEKGEDWAANASISPLLISCAYCLRAMRAGKAGKTVLAWSRITDASFWCGVARAGDAVNVLPKVNIEAIKAIAKAAASVAIAKAGQDGRDKSFEPLREYSRKLALESKPESGWRSRNQAVEAIMERVGDFAQGKKKRKPAKDTVDGWLRDMPEASSLFPPSGKK